MGPTGCPKTSVRNYHYHYPQRNSPEQLNSLVLTQANNIHKTARQAAMEQNIVSEHSQSFSILKISLQNWMLP
jgi:hypothetical protein